MLEAARRDGIRSCTLQGGGALEEQLVTSDDGLRRFPYRIIGGDMPVEFHLGSIDVLPDRDGALVVYSADLSPDELRGQMDGVIAEGLDGLKAHLEA